MQREYKVFSKGQQQYRGNLHSHSKMSDGLLTVEEVKRLYQLEGYHFICTTDHEIYTDFRNELNEATFIVLPGIEASCSLITEKFDRSCIKTHHVLGILGTKKMIQEASKPLLTHKERIEPKVYREKWNGAKAAQELVDEIKSHGMLVTYNHPAWSRVDVDEFIHLKHLWALEVYNYASETECGLGDSSLYWDRMLATGTRLCAIATDDNHNTQLTPDTFGGDIMVIAEELSHEEIVKSMDEGKFYSSSGVRIQEWGIQDNKVYVACDKVSKINFITDGKLGGGKTVWGKKFVESITYGEFELNGTETYVRIECVDQYGRKAWTNPYYLLDE